MIRVPCVALMLGLWLSLSTGAAVSPATAQELLSGGRIDEIRVEGSQRIEPETVRSYMRVNPGDDFDPVTLDKSLKSIFATGLFADVTLRRDGTALIVNVVENPIINRIAFEGNDRLDNEVLEAEVTLRPRVVFTRTKVQKDAQRILELYRRSGRFAATVDPKVIQLPQNRVDLVFEISEGELTGINAINFIGNREYSDGRLREAIATSETAFYRILSTTDTYDPDRLTFDRELLRRFYLSEGYADFRVNSVVAELAPDREGFIITFTVVEGEQYDFGKIDVQTTLRNLDPEQVRDALLAEEGETYDASAVEDTVSNLTDAVGNLGYAFVDIRPKTDRDAESRKIDIVFDIQEGPKVFVERIDIEGNTRTLDKVIRREFRLVEGDAFNSTKLRRSRRRIQRLGFFQAVTVDNQPGSTPDKTVLNVNVEEQSTGDISFGAGFSTQSGPLASVGIRERNLLGRGQDLRFNVSVAGSGSQADVSFTEPYFLDRELAAGFDIFRVTTEDDSRAFDEERLGFSLRGGYALTEDIRHVVRYTLENTEISDVDDDAAIQIRSEEGKSLRSSIGNDFTYDTRDSQFDTREGEIVRLRTTVAGLGGDRNFFKATLGGGYYYTVADDWTFSTRGEVGQIIGLGEDTRIADRFFVGGSRPRGFEIGGISPRDRASDDALGANSFYSGTLELTFPLGLPEEFDIRGRLFTDVGASFGIDGSDAGVDDSSSPRVTIGTGVSWNSPFGPIVVDLGYAVIKEDFDETEILNFSFGTNF